jgi:hypothetical protein
MKNSFIDYCRFNSSAITRHGITTRSWVFQLCGKGKKDSISFDMHEKKALHFLSKEEVSRSREASSILNEMEHEAGEFLIARLERYWSDYSLVGLIQRNLNIKGSRPRL